MKVLQERGRPETTDDTLVRVLFAEHGQAIFSHVRSMTADSGAAEDIVQETMLRAWRHADRLHPQAGSVRWWLLTVARNLAIDRLRLRKKHPPVADSCGAVGVQRDHADSVVDSLIVLEALGHLPAIHREVVERLYLRGCTVQEVAESLGIPPGTVKSRSHYGIRALRPLLADYWAGR